MLRQWAAHAPLALRRSSSLSAAGPCMPAPASPEGAAAGVVEGEGAGAPAVVGLVLRQSLGKLFRKNALPGRAGEQWQRW